MDKENVVYIYNTYTHIEVCYSAIKKKEILSFVTTCMDLEGIIISEIRQRNTNII